MLKKIFITIIILGLSQFYNQDVNAQAICSGSGYSCCTSQTQTCLPVGCIQGVNCTCTTECTNTKSGPCSHLQAEGGGCGVLNTNTSPPCISTLQVSCSSSSTPTCPGSQVWCGAQGACAAACRDISGYPGCQQWLNANCGGAPTPTPAPGCTPSCSQPYCGQSNGCGGTCATTDGVQSLNTPTILTNRPTQNGEYLSPVRIDWFNVSNVHRYRVQVEEILGGGNFTIVHDENNYTDSEVYLPLSTGYYRVRVRAIQKWNSYGQCPPSDWSTWRRFYIVDPPATCGDGICNGGEACDDCPADCGVCACTPDCSGPQCGQDDGCGDVCPNTDGATLPAPTLTSPADGALVNATGTDPKVVQLSITKTSSASLRIEVYPYGTSCFHDLAVCETIVNSDPIGSVVNYNFSIPLADYGDPDRFQWRATHENLLCGGGNETYSAWREFTLGDEITGTILLDTGGAGLSGGICTSPYTPTNYTPEGVEEIQARIGGTTYTGTIESDGDYSVMTPFSVSGVYSVDFISNRESDTCGCPGGCTYSNVASPTDGLNFYYQPVLVRDPWWQTINGHIYAENQNTYAISSEIPDTCTGVCTPYLSLQNASGDENSTGVVISGGGAVDVSNTAGNQTNQIDEENQHRVADGVIFGGVLENYAYFERLYSMIESTTSDVPSNGQKPTQPPSNGRAYFYDGNLTINSTWDISNTESMVVFINGDLNLESTTQVAEGGFLAFIVNGNITIDESVCQSDHTSSEAVVEGVFVADDNLIIGGAGNSDCRFVGEGIFVGWQGMELERDFRTGLLDAQDGWNAYYAVDLFRYRPDFLVNLPERMARSLYFWQEVAP